MLLNVFERDELLVAVRGRGRAVVVVSCSFVVVVSMLGVEALEGVGATREWAGGITRLRVVRERAPACISIREACSTALSASLCGRMLYCIGDACFTECTSHVLTSRGRT